MTHKMLHNQRDYYIYIVISETPTKFGNVIRRFANIQYNHASIAFDEKLKQLYSFGRRQYRNPLDAGLIKEYPDRFSLRQFPCVNVRIYKVPVTKQQYIIGKRRILEIKHDADGYLYNLFSVLSYPILKGFQTYKAYSCAEFTAHMIRTMGIELTPEKRNCEFTPQEIGEQISNCLMFEGNLLDYCKTPPLTKCNFFDNPGYRRRAKTSVVLVFTLLYRMMRFKASFAAFQ